MAWLDREGEILDFVETTGEYLEDDYYYDTEYEPAVANVLSVEEEENKSTK